MSSNFNLKEFRDEMSLLPVKKDDVIIFKFDPDMNEETLQYINGTLNGLFPDNPVLGLTADVDVLIQSPKEAVEMLEKMIEKVTSAQSVSKENKLIL